jgi:anti-sigma B factor antagonist
MGERDTVSDVFRIDEERPREDTVLLAVHGDADVHTAGELRERLSDAIDGRPRTVVVDLSGVTFVDSMALGVLLGSMKRLRLQSGQLLLVAPATEIRRIFEITLLDRVLALVPTRGEAFSMAYGSRSAGG